MDGFIQFQNSRDIFWRIGLYLMQNLRAKNASTYLLETGFELGSPLKMILRSEHSSLSKPAPALSSLYSPSFWAWAPQSCRLLRMEGLVLDDVLLVGPISSGYRWHHNPFAQRKNSYSLFPVDGMLILVTFFEESKSSVMQSYFMAPEKLFAYC